MWNLNLKNKKRHDYKGGCLVGEPARRGSAKGEEDEGVNMITAHYMNAWKYVNKTLCPINVNIC
jgi:hypothetical protein